MANELAAMAGMPRGATMTVVMICAPQMTMCSRPIGRLIRMEFRIIGGAGRDGLLCHAFIFKPDERVKRYHKVMAAATLSASPVPKAAPCTPNPAPGMDKVSPPTDNSRDGKMRKKLKTTSRMHISTPAILGMRMLPLQRNMPAARKFICRMGRKSEKIRK